MYNELIYFEFTKSKIKTAILLLNVLCTNIKRSGNIIPDIKMLMMIKIILIIIISTIIRTLYDRSFHATQFLIGTNKFNWYTFLITKNHQFCQIS